MSLQTRPPPVIYNFIYYKFVQKNNILQGLEKTDRNSKYTCSQKPSTMYYTSSCNHTLSLSIQDLANHFTTRSQEADKKHGEHYLFVWLAMKMKKL